jgi:hypothetical protein
MSKAGAYTKRFPEKVGKGMIQRIHSKVSRANSGFYLICICKIREEGLQRIYSFVSQRPQNKARITIKITQHNKSIQKRENSYLTSVLLSLQSICHSCSTAA